MNLLKLFPRKPLVSVVIPTYKAGKTIANTINSVIGQTYKNIEILVADDGSDDDTVGVIKTINDKRIKIFQLTNHINANVARNHGIDQARGKYIAFLDADDEWLPDHIEKKLGALLRYKKMGFRGIYGGVFVRRPDFPLKPYPVKPRYSNESMLDYLLRAPYCAQTSTQLMTTASARVIKFDPQLYRHQDYDFLCRYHKRFKMLAERNITVIYNINPGKIFTDDLDKKFDSCVRFITSNKDDIRNNNVFLRYLKFMRQHSIDLVGPKYNDAYSKLIQEFEDKIKPVAGTETGL